MSNFDSQRRQILKTSCGRTAWPPAASCRSRHSPRARRKINMQLGWIPASTRAAKWWPSAWASTRRKASSSPSSRAAPTSTAWPSWRPGRYEVGQVSSSPSVMLAVSQGLPIKCFAVGAQKHPFTFFSLAKNPVKKPADLVGKKVGIPSTAAILLRALLAKNKIAEKDVTVVTVGSDMAPLLTGQVDVVTGWLTSTTALKVAGPGPCRPDACGTRRAALCAAVLRDDQDAGDAAQGARSVPARHLAAAGSTPRRTATRPSTCWSRSTRTSSARTSASAMDVMLRIRFGDAGQTQGWGAMDPAVWQDADHAVLGAGPVHRQDAEARGRHDAGHAQGHGRGARMKA